MSSQEWAKKIKQARLKKKLTQEEVAKKASMNANYYAVIERGEVNAGADKLQKIAGVLGIKLLS